MAEDNTGTLQFFSPTPILSTSPSTATGLSLSAEPTVTACSQSLLELSYTGPSGDSVTIDLYGARVDDPSTPIEKTIFTANNIEGQNQIFWNVNVAQGAYIAHASIPSLGLMANSSAIIVLNGTDTSCLSSPSSPLTFSPLPSTSLIGSTTTTPTNTTSPTATGSSSLPMLGGNQALPASHKMSVASIAGSAVGAFAALLTFGVFLYLLRRWRSRRGTEITGYSHKSQPSFLQLG